MSLTTKQVILVVTGYGLCAISTFAVILRCIARRIIRSYNWDDLLMVIGQGLFIALCISVIQATYEGLGLTDAEIIRSGKIPNLLHNYPYQLVYYFAITIVKSSICFTLLRIAPITRRWIRYYIIAILVLAILSGIVTLAGTLSLCHPISALWTGKGKCAPLRVSVSLAYFITSTNIFTDVSFAFLPTVIVWNVKLESRIKLQVVVLMSVGFLASGASIVRMAWTKYYASKEDSLYHIADLSLLTLWEVALGIIGGSVSAIKPLCTHKHGLKRFIPRSSSTTGTTIIGQSSSGVDSGSTTQDTELSVMKEGKVLTVAQHREGADDLESLRGVLAAGR